MTPSSAQATSPRHPPSPTQDWPVSRPLITGIIAILVLVAGFGGWAASANIAGAIIAPGTLELAQHRQVIQHPDGGVVARVEVREGDVVQAGDPLIALDSTQLQSQLSITESQLFEILARIARLTAERDALDALPIDPLLVQAAADTPALGQLIAGQERLFRTRLASAAQAVEQLSKRQSQIINQMGGVTAQQDAIARQLSLLQEELAAQQALLDKGLAQASRVLSLRREDARLQGQLGELAASEAESAGRITEIDLEILRLKTQREEDAITQLRDLQSRAFELREQRVTLRDQLSRLSITAPMSGQVFGLTVFAERAVIRAAEPLLYIVPHDRPLTITGQISPINIDEVHLGQDVTLRFATFDARSTPEVFGRVTGISGDVFTDDSNGQTFYRIEMALNDGEAARLGDVVLVPGMPVDAFIQTAKRTPLAYLIKPLADYFNRAFRET